ncbi:Hypothetical predicted protein [Octopus vulgaris]|uniref:Uncharacterized protein n=1 Tax=Octopus vulgaris TaxID=6645 RepID=A0AA36FIR1_OCTVU|nr:Hypothetical predicted protein [Octopus vulgaris]
MESQGATGFLYDCQYYQLYFDEQALLQSVLPEAGVKYAVFEASNIYYSQQYFSNGRSTNSSNGKKYAYQNRPLNLKYHPLKDTHEYALFCKDCFPIHANKTFQCHRCQRNILAFVEKGTPYWNRVREYTNQNGTTKIPEPCRNICYDEPGSYHENEERCIFAHNPLEIKLWRQEIKGKFNVQYFIEYQQKTRCDINYIISTYGQMYEFICKTCSERGETCKESSDNPYHCAGSVAHYWEGSKILQCFTRLGIFKIRKPFTVRKDAFYLICDSAAFCNNSRCTYAHSRVERDIWRLERDQGFTQERLVEFSNALQFREPSNYNDQPAMFYIGLYNNCDNAGREGNLISSFVKESALCFNNGKNEKLTLNNVRLHGKMSKNGKSLASNFDDASSKRAMILSSESLVDETLSSLGKNGRKVTKTSHRVKLFRRSHYPEEEGAFRNEVNTGKNETSQSLAAKSSSVCNGNYDVCIEANGIPRTVTLLRRPTGAENSENSVDFKISNNTFAASALQAPSSAENGAVDPNSFVIHEGPRISNPYRRSFSDPENNGNLLEHKTAKYRIDTSDSIPNGYSCVENRAIDNECLSSCNPWPGVELLQNPSKENNDNKNNDSCMVDNEAFLNIHTHQQEPTVQENDDFDDGENIVRDIFHYVLLGENSTHYVNAIKSIIDRADEIITPDEYENLSSLGGEEYSNDEECVYYKEESSASSTSEDLGSDSSQESIKDEMSDLKYLIKSLIYICSHRITGIVLCQSFEAISLKITFKFITFLDIMNIMATGGSNSSDDTSDNDSFLEQREFDEVVPMVDTRNPPFDVNWNTNYSETLRYLYSHSNSCNETTKADTNNPNGDDYHPLINTHAYALFCQLCFPVAIDNSFEVHRCERDILVFVERGTPFWHRVRESITECSSFKIPELCRIPPNEHIVEDRCIFAHNLLEIKLWRQEFQGNFNVRDFIKFQRTTRCDVNYIMSTYGHHFEFICKSCLREGEISKECSDDPNHCNGSIPHTWETSKVLRYVTQSGEFIIRKPFDLQKNIIYLPCESSSSCETDSCIYAHNEVEKDIWRLERDQGITQERLVVFSRALEINAAIRKRNSEQPARFNNRTDSNEQNSEQNQAVNSANVRLGDNQGNHTKTAMLGSMDASYHRESIEAAVDFHNASLYSSFGNGQNLPFDMLSPYVYIRKPLVSGEDGATGGERNGDVGAGDYPEENNWDNGNFHGTFVVPFSMVSRIVSPSVENREIDQNCMVPREMSPRGASAAASSSNAELNDTSINNNNGILPYPYIGSLPTVEYPRSFDDCIPSIYERYQLSLHAEAEELRSSLRETPQDEEDVGSLTDVSSLSETEEFTDMTGK